MTTGDGSLLVEQAREITEELAARIGRLVAQLSSTAPAPSLSELEEIVSSPGSLLLLGLLEGRLVGMLTLVTYRIPTGLNAVIDDVVVDEEARRSGAATALVEAALAEARWRGARHVDLTSRPSREAANHLYKKMGFDLRETNVYRRLV